MEHCRYRLHSGALNFVSSQAVRLAWPAEAHLLAGRRDKALPVALDALELARRHGERGHEASVLRLLGAVHGHRDPPDTPRAEEHYRLASGLAGGLGMRPLLAHCDLGLGALDRRVGRRREAEECLRAVAVHYREMAMRFWFARVEAELAALG